MGIPSSNPKSMMAFSETSPEMGGGATALDVPTLREIAQDSPERAQERMEEFRMFAEKLITECEEAFRNGTGTTEYGLLASAAMEVAGATGDARRAHNVGLEQKLITLQYKLYDTLDKVLSDHEVKPLNPFVSYWGVHEYAREVMRDKILDQKEKEKLVETMQKEAESRGIEVTKEIGLNKEKVMLMGKQIQAANPELQKRVDAADKVIIITNPAEKVPDKKEGRSWATKALIVGGKVMLVCALGVAAGALITYCMPEVAAWVTSLFARVSPGLPEKIATFGRDAIAWAKEGFSSISSILFGAEKSAKTISEGLKEAVRETAEMIGGPLQGVPGSSKVEGLKDLFQGPGPGGQ